MAEQAEQLLLCAADPAFFIWNYVKVKDDGGTTYTPFHLWPSQLEILDGLMSHKQVALLKARRLGMSSLTMAYALWVARFIENSNILVFSKGLRESMDLIEMVRQFYFQLPPWMRLKVVTDTRGRLEFANGSKFIAFGSKKSGGDSYSSQLSIVDECDLLDDLDTLLGGIVPATEKGQIVLLSRPDKSKPESRFKKLFRSGAANENGYWAKFLPWWAKPGRTQAYYDEQARDNASTDWMWEQFPASIEEALAPRQESKRLPAKWLQDCYRRESFNPDGPIAGVPGFRIYRDPIPGRQYVLGGDPAGGHNNPNTDFSVATVLDKHSHEQVAVLASKVEPSLFAAYIAQLARHYHHNGRSAGILIESNNHGGTVLSFLQNNCPDVTVLKGPNGKPGFLTTAQTQILRYDKAAEELRAGGVTIHDEATFHELSSIETATLKAPEGLHDDHADAWTIALWAALAPTYKFEVETVDLGTGRVKYEKPNPGDTGDGIVYTETDQAFSVSLPTKNGEKWKAARVNVGNFKSQALAAYAHTFASQLLGYPPKHPADSEGEVTPQDRVRIEAQVREKLKQTRQHP